MKLSAGLLFVSVVLLAACGGGGGGSAGMDGMIDGVPVAEYEATTTVPGEDTTAAAPGGSIDPVDTTVPAEDEGSPASPDFVAWRLATAAVCEEYEPQVQALAAELAPPDTLDAAAIFYDRMNPLNARYMRAIVAVPVPDDRAEDVEALYALATDLKDVARVAQAAAHFGDQAPYDISAGGLAASTASANELLLDLGVPECVSTADGGSA